MVDPKASEPVYFELKLPGNKNTQEVDHKESLGDRVEVVICQCRYSVNVFANCFKTKFQGCLG